MKQKDKVLTILVGGAVLQTLFNKVDTSLAYTHYVPYGPLWAVLNPFYQTQWPYRIYLSLFLLVALGCMVYAVKKWDLPYGVAYLHAMVVSMFVQMHIHQNVTVIAFAWTAWFFWPLMGLAIQKLPIGWSLDLKDNHWQCLSTCFNYRDGMAREGWSHLFDRSSLHTVVYLMQIGAITAPVIARAWGEWKTRRQTLNTQAA